MAYALLVLLRIVLAAGAVIGLGMCFVASVNGDWRIALISGAVYMFSLVMLS
jgi:hypothetical protein